MLVSAWMNTDYFLKPGELIVTRNPIHITTVLGSCISVSLFDPVLKLGGMNHYMLPFWNGRDQNPFKYGNCAIKALVDRMVNHGAVRDRMVAGIFGGACSSTSVFKIGHQNAMIAQEALHEQGIKIPEQNVGGKYGRKIRFSVSTNEVIINYLN